MDWWSGENDWTFVSYSFEAGSHVFEWLYDKNKQGASGEDCVWIDDITFPRASIFTAMEETVDKKGNAIYPNPSNGKFTIALAEESNVNILNVLGINVMRLNRVNGLQQISLDDMPRGLYFVQIQSGKNIEIKKLVIE